jgi:hypothetical protein
LGGLAATCGGAFGLLWSAITGVRNEADDGRKAIWGRLTTIGDHDADRRETLAKTLATREDMAELRDELEEMIESRLKLQEVRIADMIRYEVDNRKPPHGV